LFHVGLSGRSQDFLRDFQDLEESNDIPRIPAEHLWDFWNAIRILAGFSGFFQDSFRILMLMDSQLWIRIRQLQPKVVGWGRKKILQGFFPTRSRNSRRIHEMIGKRNWTLSSSSRPLLILIPIQPES